MLVQEISVSSSFLSSCLLLPNVNFTNYLASSVELSETPEHLRRYRDLKRWERFSQGQAYTGLQSSSSCEVLLLVPRSKPCEGNFFLELQVVVDRKAHGCTLFHSVAEQLGILMGRPWHRLPPPGLMPQHSSELLTGIDTTTLKTSSVFDLMSKSLHKEVICSAFYNCRLWKEKSISRGCLKSWATKGPQIKVSNLKSWGSRWEDSTERNSR